MTTQDLLKEVYERSGEPTDLCPYTTPGDESTFDTALTTEASVRLLRWVNRGLVRIANWKGADGRPVRSKALLDRMFFTNKAALEYGVVSATSSTVNVDGFTPNNIVDQFAEWIVEVIDGTGQGQTRIVTGCSGTGASECVINVHKAFDTTPDSTSVVSLRKRFFEMLPSQTPSTYMMYHMLLDPTQELSDIVKIVDVESQLELEQVARIDLMTSTSISDSEPSAYCRFGNRLYFDTANSAEKVYQLVYYRHPTALSSVNQIPELPEALHEAIVLWATHSIQMREQDFNGAYATKRDLQELMATVRPQGEFENMFSDSGVSVYEG